MPDQTLIGTPDPDEPQQFGNGFNSFLDMLQQQEHKAKMKDTFVGMVMCVYAELNAIDPLKRTEKQDLILQYVENLLFYVERVFGYAANNNNDTFEDYASGLRANTLISHHEHPQEMVDEINSIMRRITGE